MRKPADLAAVSPAQREAFTQDEFLRAPALFKYGPCALLIVGALLAASFFVAAYWRIDAGRKGVYEDALHFSLTVAGAVREGSTQVFGRLRQATYSLQALANEDRFSERLHKAFADGLGLRGDGIEALAITRAGAVAASTVPMPLAALMARRIETMARSEVPVATQMLPAIPSSVGGRRIVPVVQPIDLPADIEYLVYLVDAALFTAVAERAFADQHAWLRLEDENGRTLFETWTSSPRATMPGAPLQRRIASVEDAMAQPMHYDSDRLLVAATAPNADGLTAIAGLQESDALAPFKQRVDATWLIAGFASTLLMVLVGITALALRKFAVKERYLRRLATVDILSGMPNRRSFNHLLGRSVANSARTGEPFALFFVDLDNFKYVNDTLGHEAGDELLRHVAKVLSRAVGRRGKVCRLGGDEFTVLVPGLTGVEAAQSTGNALVEALRAPLQIGGVEVQPRASVGVSLMPLHASTGSDLMRFADTAMYRAKKDGKGCCVVYGDAMAAEELGKVAAVRDLERAIAHGEFFLVYQPKYQTASGALAGFEALVRWQHPERGIVNPGEFIDLAEETGLIGDLGDWVLERSVQQVRRWHDEGSGWHQVAVNVSPLQLRSKDFANRVRAVLDRYQVPGRFLQIELTETSLASDTARAQSLVHALRALGVSIAVDDFGTGYSSMGALQRFELDCLKVDRSFINAVHTPHGQEICRAVISLGHALNMRVIAEGVETQEQCRILGRLGCDEVQGYLYAAPMSAAEAIYNACAMQTGSTGGRPRPLVAHRPPTVVAA